MVQVRKRQPVIVEGQLNIAGWVAHLEATLELDNIDAIKKACQLTQQLSLACEVSAESDRVLGNCFYGGLEIAEVLAELKLDSDSLVAGILYRSVREELLTLSQVRLEFSVTVAKLIEGVLQMDAISAVQQLSDKSVFGGQHLQVENVRKMLVAIVDDVRVALIKLAERTWAIRAVKNSAEVLKQKVAREVSEIYAPLAHRLGIGYIKWELEDIAFRYLSPDRYKAIAKLLDGRRLDREDYIAKVVNLLESKLRADDVAAVVTGRAKHIYSIARKMEHKHIDFEQVYDASAVRILVPDVKDCYTALGLVHSLWRHISHEFDDYIATPKANGYRSLHTAVIGPEGKAMEVQIRSHAMHQESEFGVCSHWQYKGADRQGRSHSYEEKIDWLRQVLQWHEEVGDISHLADELQRDVEADRIYVFTPKGHVVDLVNGATPVDFAYRVHTEVGNHCRGARVNNAIVCLNHVLKIGDQVEILTAEHATPRREWLNPALGYTRAGRTRSKVQHWFKLQDKEVNADAGLVMVEHEINRFALLDVDFNQLVAAMGYDHRDDMCADIGAGELPIAQVIHKLQYQLMGHETREQLALQLADADKDKHVAAVTIDWQGGTLQSDSDVITRLAECCKPLPGDDCLGYVQQRYGVAIHRRDCEQMIRFKEEDPERIVQVDWAGSPEQRHGVDLVVRALDRHGLMHEITGVLSKESVNLTEMSVKADPSQGLVELYMTIEVSGLVMLSRVLDKVGQLPNLVEVKRYRK